MIIIQQIPKAVESQLIGGPGDGLKIIASHDCLFHDGELYVQRTAGEFLHAKTEMQKLSEKEREAECAAVKEWFNLRAQKMLFNTVIPPKNIPAWRVKAWMILILTKQTQ